jgi:integrase/recombinase XerD
MKPSDLLNDFLAYMKSKKKSPNTIKGYNSDLTKFIDYITIKNLPITEIKLRHLENYLATIDAKESSMNRYISSIQSFFKYLHKMDIIDNNPSIDLERPLIPDRQPIYLTIDESLKLLESIDGRYEERDYAIVTLFLNCGMRLSELISIDINKINGNILTVIGKGNKERTVYLNEPCITAINDYLAVRPVIEGENALFISKNKRRITGQAVEDIIEKYIGKANLDTDKYTPHKLRHTAASLMYQNGTDVRDIKDILGHENINTTLIYAHTNDDRLRKAVNSNPLAKAKRKKN